MNKVLIAGALLALSAAAHADGIREGKWEYTVSMKMAGMPEMPPLPPGTQLPPGMQMPSMGPNGMTTTFQQCVTNSDPVPHNKRGREDCQVTKMDRQGSTVSYAIHCTDDSGGAMDGTGSASYNGDSMTSTMTMKGTSHGHPIDMTQTTTGRYLGDCGK